MGRYFYSLLDFLPSLFRPQTGGVLYAILSAFATLFHRFSADLDTALRQMNILTSRGFFLNFWGYLFKVKRYGDLETDLEYARRIVRTVLVGRNTAAGIRAVVHGLIVDDMVVEEYTLGTVVDFDYKTFNYTTHYSGAAFLLRVQYQAHSDSSMDDMLFANHSFIGVNSFIMTQAGFQMTADVMVHELIDAAKLAGVKVIYNRA